MNFGNALKALQKVKRPIRDKKFPTRTEEFPIRVFKASTITLAYILWAARAPLVRQLVALELPSQRHWEQTFLAGSLLALALSPVVAVGCWPFVAGFWQLFPAQRQRSRD